MIALASAVSTFNSNWNYFGPKREQATPRLPGRAGGRDLQVGQCKSGQGAWEPGELPQDNAAPRARRLDKLKWHARALVDRTRCPILEASLAAKARWPWLSHFRTHSHPPTPLGAKARRPTLLPSRTCPTHPPPKGSAKPLGGWERLAPRARHPRPGRFGKRKPHLLP